VSDLEAFDNLSEYKPGVNFPARENVLAEFKTVDITKLKPEDLKINKGDFLDKMLNTEKRQPNYNEESRGYVHDLSEKVTTSAYEKMLNIVDKNGNVRASEDYSLSEIEGVLKVINKNLYDISSIRDILKDNESLDVGPQIAKFKNSKISELMKELDDKSPIGDKIQPDLIFLSMSLEGDSMKGEGFFEIKERLDSIKKKLKRRDSRREIVDEMAFILKEKIREHKKKSGERSYEFIDNLSDMSKMDSLDCDVGSMFYIQAAEKLGLPIAGVYEPSHMYVRWINKDNSYYNWETIENRFKFDDTKVPPRKFELKTSESVSRQEIIKYYRDAREPLSVTGWIAEKIKGI